MTAPVAPLKAEKNKKMLLQTQKIELPKQGLDTQALDINRQDDIEGVRSLGLPHYKKENKQQLFQYINQLEGALSQYKNKLNNIQKDHQVLNDSYMDELNRNGKIENAINVLKRIIFKLLGRDHTL